MDIELHTYVALLTSDSPAGVPDVLVMSPADPAPVSGTLVNAGDMPQLIEIPMPEEIRERYLIVREVATEEVITVIEVLSLANKLTNEGRDEHLAKRLKVLGSKTNLVEIDLLRAGEPMPPFISKESAYRILVSPFTDRPQARAYRFGIREPIPDIPIPLRPGERESILPLNQLIHEIYERGSYDLALDYTQSAEPPLAPEDAVWARTLVDQRIGG